MRWESEAFGHDYRAEVLERDYEGEPEAKALGAAPTLRMDDSESGVRGTSLELTIQADRDGELTTLYTTDNKRYRVDLYRDEELAWTGYVLPEEYSEPYVSAPYDVAVTATDGLGILKDIPFELTGERTIFEVVAYCCGQTGLSLDYALLSALMEEGMAAGEPMHTQTMCDAGAFAGMDCYEALEAAMTSLDSFVTEWRGMWLVARHTDLTGTYTRHSASGQKTGTGQLPELTLGAIGDDCYPVGSLGMEVVPAARSVKFTCDYGKRGSMLKNYDFYHGKQGWTFSDPSNVFHYYWNGHGYLLVAGNTQSGPRVSVRQSVRISGGQDLTVRISAAMYRLLGDGGDPSEYNVKIFFEGDDGKSYWLGRDGWKDEEAEFTVGMTLSNYVSGGIQLLNFSEFAAQANGLPTDGTLTVEIIALPFEGVNHKVMVKEVAVTNEDAPEGVDVTANLNERASTDGEDVELMFLDAPEAKNARLLYERIVWRKDGGLTSAWRCGESQTDSLAHTILKSVCSRTAYPRRRLGGTIQGEEPWTMWLARDKYSNLVMCPTEASLNLLTDESAVTLEQHMPYQELSGELEESERTTGGNGEYRSSGENEKRVWQAGAGTPMRIRDLAKATGLGGDSVVEVDGTGKARSEQATLAELAELFAKLTDAWTKREMQVAEGYLTVLGAKIKAGWADDAGKWEGRKFGEWLDQPVRTTDNVQFKSVKGSNGTWEISSLGDLLARLIVVTGGLQTDNFAAGLTGTGFGVVNKSEAHMDKAVVRKYLEVLSLVVAQMFYRGGRQVLSPAGMKVNRVEEGDTYYRLFMETEDGQRNEFTAGAQARCDRYGTGQRYWWRLVTAVGTDYIEVSKTDRDEGSMAPEVGDEVVQFGHRTDPYLQWVVMDSSFSDDAGRTVYAGVDSYSLDGKMVLREGVDPKDGGRIGLFLADGTEVSTAIGSLREEVDGLGEGLRMDIAAEEGTLVVDGAYDGDLVATVWRRWKDITSTVEGWAWTRQSGTDGASLASDALWNEAHAGVRSGRIRITGADIVTDTVKFVCDATVGGQTVRGIFNGQ